MTSIEAAEAIKKGIAKVNQSIDVVMIPMADGEEGTVDAVTSILKGEKLSAEVQDPLGRKLMATFGWLEETKTAVIETAAASGLPLLKTEELDPEKASTFGTGELVVRALDLGARRIIIGLGGSATVDGGTRLPPSTGNKISKRQWK